MGNFTIFDEEKENPPAEVDLRVEYLVKVAKKEMQRQINLLLTGNEVQHYSTTTNWFSQLSIQQDWT